MFRVVGFAYVLVVAFVISVVVHDIRVRVDGGTALGRGRSEENVRSGGIHVNCACMRVCVYV